MKLINTTITRLSCAVLSYGMLACSGSDSPAKPGNSQDAGHDAPTNPDPDATHDTRWTIFVYGHADHNLAPSLDIDIAKMDNARLTPNVNVIVLADWDASRQRPSGEHFPTGSHWIRIVGSGMPHETDEMLPEQNLNDPAVLKSAVTPASQT